MFYQLFNFVTLSLAVQQCVAFVKLQHPPQPQPQQSINKYTEAALRDEITELPGLELDIKQFSGYIDVGNDRHIFYWFIESLNNPVDDPVFLWTNGGPGCGGLNGLLEENGAFFPDENGNLVANEHSWSKLASIVYLEAPAGVGFSYNTGKKINYGDTQTAKDNYQFLINFMERFPQFKKNDLYLTSESYGGHYLPTLAQEIVRNGGLNLKGFAVGNPLTYLKYRNYGQYATYWNHQLLPKPDWEQFLALKCDDDVTKTECVPLINKFDSLTQHLNPYALDFPICNAKTAKGHKETFFLKSIVHRSAFAEEELTNTRYFPENYVPCINEYTSKYLNRKDVKAAIHARQGIDWQDCNGYINVNFNQTEVNRPMMSIYQELVNEYDLNIMIYSGDDDSICSTFGTQMAIWDMGFKIVDEWKVWEYEKQVAGYTVAMKGEKGSFRFSTVHGAGHMVPATRPAQSLEILRKFLENDF